MKDKGIKKDRWKYVSEPRVLFGFKKPNVCLVGNYYDHPHWFDLEIEMHHRQAVLVDFCTFH